MLLLSPQSRLLGTNPTLWLCQQEQVRTFQKGPRPKKLNLKQYLTYLSQFTFTVHHIQGLKDELRNHLSRKLFAALLGQVSRLLAKDAFNVWRSCWTALCARLESWRV